MTSLTSNNAKVVWQTAGEDNIPEPAIIVNGYSDCIELDQEGNCIRLNIESIPEIIKVLRSTALSFKK